MRRIFIAVIPLCIEGALQVGGFQNIYLAWTLIGVSIVLSIYCFWPEISNTVRRLKGNGVQFFENRAAFPKLDHTFANQNQISGIFLSAEGLFAEDKNRMNLVTRICLPNPNCTYLKLFKEGFIDPPEQIKKTTRLAIERGKDVRWFSHFIGMGILFCNAEGLDAWVQVDLSIPFVAPIRKPGIRIEKRLQSVAFSTLYNSFNEIWQKSIVPNPKDYS
jgi:hypothetical protein